jgi:hypothetical protein
MSQKTIATKNWRRWDTNLATFWVSTGFSLLTFGCKTNCSVMNMSDQEGKQYQLMPPSNRG